MSNFAGAIRDEIRRLARKELRASVGPLRKTVTALRRRVVEQRKLIQELERAARQAIAAAKMGKGAVAGASPAATDPDAGPQVRFSPRWVKQHRKRVGLSRRLYAKLLGVSAQSIFGWESGRSRPRRDTLRAWRRLRGMGAREIKAMLAQSKPASGRKGSGRKRPTRSRTAGARRARSAATSRRAKKK